MKKRIGILFLVLVLAGGAGAGIWYFRFRGNTGSSSEDAVFVDSVGVITGLSASDGTLNRFSGVIEPQKTVSVQIASGMTVKETYVTVGQEVKVGDKLFAYDTEDAQDSITQLEIDIENEEISIESAEAQITQLEKERDKVSGDEKLSYTTQIMTTQNSIKRSEYTIKSKQAEMESLKKQIANAVVTSEQQGVIKTINSSLASSDTESDMSDYSSTEDSSAYITIMATGDYLVKGKINEQNMSQIMEGEPVIVHSRVDESLTWKGTISSIDKDNSSTNQSSSYYYSDNSSMTSSSTYPFYVELESSDGLMLGQHVYIVMDEGQEDDRDGMWLEDYYFITDEDGAVTPYVWAADANDRLEKRKITFGDYDDELMMYEIVDGLTVDDYIAFPGDDLEEGLPVTRNVDQVSSYSDDDYLDDSYYDDSYYDDEYDDDSYEGLGIEGAFMDAYDDVDFGEDWIEDEE